MAHLIALIAAMSLSVAEEPCGWEATPCVLQCYETSQANTFHTSYFDVCLAATCEPWELIPVSCGEE